MYNIYKTTFTIAVHISAHNFPISEEPQPHNTCTQIHTQEKVILGRNGHNRVLVLSACVIGKAPVWWVDREQERGRKKGVWEQGGGQNLGRC